MFKELKITAFIQNMKILDNRVAIRLKEEEISRPLLPKVLLLVLQMSTPSPIPEPSY